MPRLIDADELLKAIRTDIMGGLNYESFIREAPTVDAEKHGHWIERSKVYPDFPYDSTYNYECSNCGYMDTHGADVEVPYCWHCGTKMDEVKDE